MIVRKTDLVLLHAPSVYDFRERLIIPSPIADLVPSGPVFENYPIGFSFLGEYLERHGMKVRVINLATRMLEQERFDVERHIARLKPRAFGVSLHWLPHCHGAIEVARICKRLHPDIPVIMGGYSSTIFHRELFEYPEVDFVLRGDSTEEPCRLLMEAIRNGGDFHSVPNLTWRNNETGEIVENSFEYIPEDLDHIGENYVYMMFSALRSMDLRGIRAYKGWWKYPMTAILTVKGCTRNCTFCGGSAHAMKSCFNRRKIAVRSPEKIANDVSIVSQLVGAPVFLLGDIRQPGDSYCNQVLDGLKKVNPGNYIVLELFAPAPKEYYERVGRSLRNWALEISPETHDFALRKLAGKQYSTESMEDNIAWAIENGCSKVDIFFMIGIEGQDRASVRETVAYCEHLLERFGPKVNPLIGPLAPFIDPGSINKDEADKRGYHIRFNTLEEYRNALLEPHWRDLLGYHTELMDRQEIVDVTYEALFEMNRIKVRHGQISAEYGRQMERLLEETISLFDRLDQSQGLPGEEKERELALIKAEADRIRSTSYMVKDEIAWPVVGMRFRYHTIGLLMYRKLMERRRARKAARLRSGPDGDCVNPAQAGRR